MAPYVTDFLRACAKASRNRFVSRRRGLMSSSHTAIRWVDPGIPKEVREIFETPIEAEA